MSGIDPVPLALGFSGSSSTPVDVERLHNLALLLDQTWEEDVTWTGSSWRQRYEAQDNVISMRISLFLPRPASSEAIYLHHWDYGDNSWALQGRRLLSNITAFREWQITTHMHDGLFFRRPLDYQSIQYRYVDNVIATSRSTQSITPKTGTQVTRLSSPNWTPLSPYPLQIIPSGGSLGIKTGSRLTVIAERWAL